ncbi:hypothetical protein [Roseimicrobium sp. ORNL1]|uniref:hypothetical protein n=1 Tax=Roseimicrobium sp. ORNL1 TaxID=2711231 RepID=UPI0013E1B439|nr:hypothetical protein [Roseimicrobium sp. ORNL1]QIF01078.1 hypothetical protein G5S37_05940 [Roseimicrobium sp. ORNL1]
MIKNIFPTYLDNLGMAVRVAHGVEAHHEGSVRVHVVMDGTTIWEGYVEIYTLEGHPEASRAFAWGREDEEEVHFISVLNVAPIRTPTDAVRAAIARSSKGEDKRARKREGEEEQGGEGEG